MCKVLKTRLGEYQFFKKRFKPYLVHMKPVRKGLQLTNFYHGGGHTGLWGDTSPRRGLCHCLKPDYAHKCRTSTLIMVPINYWQNSDPFKKKHFLAQKFTKLEHFLKCLKYSVVNLWNKLGLSWAKLSPSWDWTLIIGSV